MNFRLLALMVALGFSSVMAGSYTVQPKDTLFSIAKKFNSSVPELQKLNQLTSSSVNVGQVLIVPDLQKIHVVVAKETLFGIAKRYGVSVKAILEANKLSTPDVKIGQSLVIPISSSNSASGTSSNPASGIKPSSSSKPSKLSSSSNIKPQNSSSTTKPSNEKPLTGNPNNPIKPPSLDPFSESSQTKPTTPATAKPPVAVTPINLAPSGVPNSSAPSSNSSGTPANSNLKPSTVSPSATANNTSSVPQNTVTKPSTGTSSAPASNTNPKLASQNPSTTTNPSSTTTSNQTSSTTPNTTSSSLPPRPTPGTSLKPPTTGNVKPPTSSANPSAVLPNGRGTDAPMVVPVLKTAPLPNLSTPPISPPSQSTLSDTNSSSSIIPNQVTPSGLPEASTSDIPELIHTVVAGETLFRIATRYKVSIEDIRAANNLSSDAISIGQQLKIPVASLSTSSSSLPTVREVSQRYLGVTYRYGGSTPGAGLDCSGFVFIVYAELGVKLPRTSALQFQAGIEIERENLQEGDLVFFDTLGRGVSHVGIYLGDNQFIHAASNPGKVTISSLTEKYWQPKYLGARRVLTDD